MAERLKALRGLENRYRDDATIATDDVCEPEAEAVARWLRKTDAELAAVVTAGPDLAEPIRQAIVTLAKAR